MRQYIIRRVLQSIPILLGISIAVFVLFHALPGDPFSNMVDPTIAPADVAEARKKLGLDDPVHIQYFRWMEQIVQGNLGWSNRFKDPVADIIGSRLGPTVLLAVASMLVTVVLGLPLGVLSATRQYTLADHAATMVAFFGISVPNFFFGLLMLKLFAFTFRWFPSNGMVTHGKNLEGMAYYLDVAHHLALPALVLGLSTIAVMMRYTRSSMLEVVRQDYVRTARSKGLAERVVIYKHALRNALIPVITILALLLPTFMSGSIIVESLFSWPGLGRLTYSSLLERDYPVLMAITLFFAVITLVFNLIADLLYAAVDPRIRYD